MSVRSLNIFAGIVAREGCSEYSHAVRLFTEKLGMPALTVASDHLAFWQGYEAGNATGANVSAVAGPNSAGWLVSWDGVTRNLDVGGVPGLATAGNAAGASQWILARHEADDTQALDALDGDYRYAAWHRPQRSLTLAVDAFSQRPLFYAVFGCGSVIAFAAHTRLLRALPGVGSEPDDAVIGNFLAGEPSSLGHTASRNVRIVPAGHRLHWSGNGAAGHPNLRRYWGPGFNATGIEDRREVIGRFEQVARAAVADRMATASDGTNAILLSGGFDSNAIAGVATTLRRAQPGQFAPLHGISAVFGTLSCDESARIRQARKYLALDGTIVDALGVQLRMANVQREITSTDFPRFNLQDALLQAELDAAIHAGAAVVHSGIGGDEIADDSGHQHDLLRTRPWWQWVATVRQIARLRGETTAAVMLTLARAALPPVAKAPYRWLRRAMPGASVDTHLDWLQPEYRSMLVRRRAQMLGERRADVGGALPFQSRWQADLWANLNHPSNQYARFALNAEIRRHGLRASAPFLDRRLHELVLGTDERYFPRRHESGQYKPLISLGLAEHMPPGLIAAPWKVEFGMYNRLQMRGMLDEVCDWLFADGRWFAERYVARDVAIELAASFGSAYDAGAPEADLHHRRLYAIVGVETWLRQL